LAWTLATRRADRGEPPSDRVWTWSDLWEAIRAEGGETPIVLSETGARAALIEAIDRARTAGSLEATTPILDSAGFRRRAARRLARWTAAGRDPTADGETTDPIEADLFRLYREYQAVLSDLNAVDEANLALWSASMLLMRLELPVRWGLVERLAVIEPPSESRPVRWALEAFLRFVPDLHVALPFEEDPGRAQLYANAARLRYRLLAKGCQERPAPLQPRRPEGFALVLQRLFRNEEAHWGSITRGDGLEIRGAPQGEDTARVVAAWVDERLKRGVAPEELAVVLRQWDEAADELLETLKVWGLPIEDRRPAPIRRNAAVHALRLAMTLPCDAWETDRLCRLLRHGRLNPLWDSRPSMIDRAKAAAAIRASGVYRGLSPLQRAIERMISQEPRGPDNDRPELSRRDRGRHAELARAARPILEHLAALIGRVDQPGMWPEQVDRLWTLAEELGLEPEAEPALGALFAALEDHGLVLDALGKTDARSWADFTFEVERLVHDTVLQAEPSQPGLVGFLTADEAAGLEARCVLVANLAEGAFPARSVLLGAEPEETEIDALDEDGEEPSEVDSEAASTADRRPNRGRDADDARQRWLEFDARTPMAEPTPFGREMARFLRSIGAATEDLTLLTPTADEKGEELLPAGFLEETKALFEPKALALIERVETALDPALLVTPP